MLSDLDRATGRVDEAAKHARSASDLLEILVREAPDAVAYRVSLAKASNVLGRTALTAGHREQARQAFARTVELFESLPHPASADLYNLACNEALAVPLVEPGRREAQVGRAMAAIRRAVAGGFVTEEYYRKDSDFDSLRNEPAFQQFLSDLAAR